jgi:hypothetical protein
VLNLFVSRSHNYFGYHGQRVESQATKEAPELLYVASRCIRDDRFID